MGVKIQLLEPEGFPTEALQKLRDIGSVVMAPTADTRDVGAVFTRLASILDARFHSRYPALRWIVSPTTGLNHIDTAYFASRNVEVISLRGRTEFLDDVHATAEHTLAMALALIRDIPRAFEAVRRGEWDRYPHKGTELYGKTVLIFGYGRIGRLVAPLYRAFGCHVMAHDIDQERVPADMRCDLDQILPKIDILSVHIPLCDQTRGVIALDTLSRLPSRAIVINTSRGEVLDQEQLLRALEVGALAGAAADVLVNEPDPISPALAARLEALGRRILVTPHIAGFTYESLEMAESYITRIFIEAVDGQG